MPPAASRSRSRRAAIPVGSVEWSPVEDRIAYDVARGGGYNAQVFYSKPDGTDAKRITSGGKEDNFSGSFAPDGRYWFRSAQRDPQSPDSWIYDPKTGKASIAIQYDGGFGDINDISGLPIAHWSGASSLAATPTCSCTTCRRTRRSC